MNMNIEMLSVLGSEGLNKCIIIYPQDYIK